MKHLKKFESFKSKKNYEIETVNELPFDKINYLVEKGRFDFSVDEFEVRMSDHEETKTISIPFDLFIEYIKNSDTNLKDYLESQDKSDIESILSELESFGWNFQSAIQGYVEEFISLKDFKEMEDLEDFKNDEEEEDY